MKLKLKQSEREEILVGVMRDGRKYSVRKSRNRIFTPKEWSNFFKSLKEKNKPIFDCLINTGGRINEVTNIEKKDIDFENKVITLRRVKKRNPYADGKKRKLRISTQYRDRLRKYCINIGEEESIFKMCNASVNSLMKRKLKKIGIKDWYNFSPHNIRKTFECWLNFLGSNYLLILLHMGHNESTALNHYLSTDIYDENYKFKARIILGDLYM